MKKVLLDLRNVETTEQVHDILVQQFDFPSYYGRNLDALHDLLTEITEDTCIGVFAPEMPGEPSEKRDIDRYLYKIKFVMRDAEEENSHLCVIFDRVEDNYE